MSEGKVDRGRVEELFFEALDLDATQRAAFLLERCGGDAVLLGEVSSLLESLDAPGLVPDMDEERPFGGRYPERIGEYRVVRPLGEGGMGVVLLAIREGPGFEQTVALKVLRGTFADPLLRRRLEEERRILALLEHPGIARLVDGGVTPQGQPYYAMEYVRGEELLEYCDTRELILEDRLRLFIQVCEAVHHAHQQLVVHRDLKPSNIMVTPEGLPKLLDFGIAKNLEAVASAEATAHWVTPAYASPEQMTGGAVSTLSDVYALGVLLCELLAGARPYSTRTSAPAELVRVIAEEAPSRPSELLERDTPDPQGPSAVEVARRRRSTPSRLARTLRGELDLVVLKALAKEPHRRYESAWALAEDLQRYLNGHPLSARPDSLGYRTSKFVGRHRALVGVSALGLVVGLAGVGGILWQAGQASAERDRAEAEAGRARQVTALMTDIFRLGDPTQSLGDTIGVRQVLGEGARRVDETLGDDPVLQATLFLELARIYRNLGILDEARRLGGRALDLREAHEEGTLAHADVLGFQGVVLRDAGDNEGSMALLERAIALRDALLPQGDTATGNLLGALAWQVRTTGDYDRAGALFTRGMQIQQTHLGPDAPEVATSLLGLAATFHDKGSFDEAEALLQDALEPGRAQPSPVAAAAMVNLGMIQRIRERYTSAEPFLRAALDMRERLFDEGHPAVIEARQELAVDLSALARYDEAEPLIRKNLEVGESLMGEDHEATRNALEALGTLEHDVGRFDSAVVHLERSMASKQRVRGGDHPGVVYSLLALGDALTDGGRLAQAELRYREALDMGARLGSNEGVYGALARHGLARIALERGAVGPADSLATVAMEMALETLRPNHRYVLDMKRTRARLLLAEGRAGEAAALLSAVLADEESARPSPHPRLGVTLLLLGDARAAQGDGEGARAAWARAGEELAMLPPGHPDRRRVSAALAAGR